MSYQVLARKWRPKTFQQLAGQEHVLQALVNALDNDRLHHAYLFTGTRGVGKTTIARILARCLNCEVGVSATPCGECNACRQISEGRFVDLIEVDAASRTKVEDTRELLENVQYAPTSGRYKIYLIDEVHMLSTHSFNALLKTLEEPPPHVKFLLATTDPQKLPATILSRCLQFNLKNMTPEQVVLHLQTVLQAEQIEYEEGALWLLGQAAAGSMRDALSLTDQAISFAQGQLSESAVRSMLGTIDQDIAYRLVEALRDEDGASLLQLSGKIGEFNPDYTAAVDELLALLHRLSVAQAVPEAIQNQWGDRKRVLQLAQQITAEDLQLFYQLALQGRQDLPLAPDPRIGFEMLLLRMLAFRPAGVPELPERALSSAVETGELANGDLEAPTDPAKKPVMRSSTDPIEAQPAVESGAHSTAPGEPSAPVETSAVPADNAPPWSEPQPVESELVPIDDVPAGEPTSPQPVVALHELQPHQWHQQLRQLGIGGVSGNLLSHCLLTGVGPGHIQLQLDAANAGLYSEDYKLRLEQQLSDCFAEPIRLTIEVQAVSQETPAGQQQRLKAERQQLAVDRINHDPVVRTLLAEFDAQIIDTSIRPREAGATSK